MTVSKPNGIKYTMVQSLSHALQARKRFLARGWDVKIVRF